MPQTTFTLNGKPATVSYEPGMDFLEVLREQCGIVSPKNGCSPEGACGCCAVLVDGQPVFACLRQPDHMAGREVVTLEGVSDDLRRVLGEAFLLEGAVQCGFCIPGIVIRAAGLLQRNRTQSREEIAKSLDGHLCRCTGYARIIDAIQTAGEVWLNREELPRDEPRRHSYFGEDFGLTRTTKNGHRGHGIGQSPSRYMGLEQALGSKPFVDDMHVPGMLNAAPVLSPHPRAKVLAIDPSRALEMPGVERVFTATDVPGPRGTGLAIPDLPIFVAVGETTCCVGDILALVVADTAFHARQAADRVQVEYEVYEPVTNPLAALAPGAPQVHCPGNLHTHPNLLDTTAFSRGDVDAALAASTHVIEQTFQTQPVEPAFLEPEACLAMPQGKGVKVFSQSQGCTFDQNQIARSLNLVPEDVEVALASSGGAFGAKEELSIQVQTALAAHLLGRPVKTVLTRRQSTQLHPKRHPMTLSYTVGADAEGHLLAVRVRIVGDVGGYAGTSAKCLLRAACHSCGPYRVPNVDAQAQSVFTNNPTSGAMRGFGTNQAHFAMEGIMDLLAERIGLDGWDIRERNILNPGDAFATGQIMRESVSGLRRSLEAVRTFIRTPDTRASAAASRAPASATAPSIAAMPPFACWRAGVWKSSRVIRRWARACSPPSARRCARKPACRRRSWKSVGTKTLGAKCGETWASRATTLSCAAAQRAAVQLADDLQAFHARRNWPAANTRATTFATSPPSPALRKR